MTEQTFLDDIELSVRATRVLRAAGITTREQFMALTAYQVHRFPGAGKTTAREITDLQEYLTPEPAADVCLRRLVEAVDTVNKYIDALNNYSDDLFVLMLRKETGKLALMKNIA